MDVTDPSFCGGCAEKAGKIYHCPDCGCSMHPFCGTPIGPEGFGQHVRCPSCSSTPPSSCSASSIIRTPATAKSQSLSCQLPSISPIVAAFARAQLQSKPTSAYNNESSMGVTGTSSTSTSTELTRVAPVVDLLGRSSRMTRSGV